MADNITLKNLGDIPVVEPDDSTHLLAEQDGAYARVPKDSVGGSGSGFVATFEISSDGSTATCDKTFAECKVAFENDILDARYIRQREADMMMSENTSKGKLYDVNLATFAEDGSQIMEFVCAYRESEDVRIDYQDDGTIIVMSS